MPRLPFHPFCLEKLGHFFPFFLLVKLSEEMGISLSLSSLDESSTLSSSYIIIFFCAALVSSL